MNEQVRRRQIERHCGSSIRAISGISGAEYRRRNLYLNGRLKPLYAPHLSADVIEHSLGRCRGAADAIGLRLAYSDDEFHQRHAPDNQIGRLVFDILEQLRVESLVPSGLRGMRLNLDQAFEEWDLEARGSALVENEQGLLIYSVIHTVRSRLNNQPLGPETDCLTEGVRFRLGAVIGEELSQLRRIRVNQVDYATLALTISKAISDIAETAGGSLPDEQAATVRQLLLIPPLHNETEVDMAGSGAGLGVVESGGDDAYGYHIYSREFDRQVTGDSLYRKEQRNALRQHLDTLVSAQAISVPRLAQKLQRLFAIRERAGWEFGEDEGYLDGRRLSQLVANPSYQRIFKQEKQSPFCDTVVTFLVDNSGSMKRQRFEAVTVLLDIYCRALDLAGIKCELLGFTTGGWTGGESIKAWRRDGMPADPGRLNDRLHIVYKDAETSWRRARYSICSMMNPVHYREGLDGEALAWARDRLRNRIESRKCLVMISDGAPMDTATSQYNDNYYLECHLSNVSQSIEKNGEIELRAIGIALDMEDYFKHCMALDLTGTLGNQAFQALEILFAPASSKSAT